MHCRNLLFSADPVGLGAQSDLIGAPEPVPIEAVLAAPNGGSRARLASRSVFWWRSAWPVEGQAEWNSLPVPYRAAPAT
jgi:hypothetical protein